MKGDITMSDSVTLRKTYGNVHVILAFLSLGICVFSLWGLFHFSNSFPLLLIPFLIFTAVFVNSCMSFYNHFLEAGKYMEKEERMKQQRRASKEENEEEKNETEENEEETEEIRDFATLQDSAKLRKTYGFIHSTASFTLFAGVFLLDLYLLSKDPFFAIFLFPEALIFALIYAFIVTAREYFMESGMYIEKSKRIIQR